MIFLAFIASAWEMVLLHVGRKPLVYSGALIAAFMLLIAGWFICAPFAFPRGVVVEIPANASLPVIANTLEKEHIIRSSLAMRALAKIFHTDTGLQAGRYLFTDAQDVFSILYRIEHGEYGIPTSRVTFPEGISVREMGEILSEKVSGFPTASWNAQALRYEGGLFPDTYDFSPNTTVEEIIARMNDTFNKKTVQLQQQAAAQKIAWADAVIMASIVEKEANTAEDRRIVAGILWNRIKINMALQVDATFGYIHGITGYKPNGNDPEIKSPYNTYLNRGLPPGPIGNPGLDALTAALNPTKTNYLYYLTGKDGKMHYAKTFEEHKKNQQLYLY